MKKLLIIILCILLIVLAYFVLFNGIKIGKIEILSVKQIMQNNQDLEDKITSTTKAIATDYPKAVSTLGESTKQLMDSKNAYLDLASVSSNDEISKAVQEVSYSIEYLWTRVGNHATKEGVNLKMDPASGEVSGTRNLNFAIKGSYIGIINFIYAIENDAELGFKIETFKLIPGGGSNDLQATFVVKNLKIKIENVQSSVPQTNENTTTNTTENTNTTGNNNTTGNANTNTTGNNTNR